jgi:hypothetical protein
VTRTRRLFAATFVLALAGGVLFAQRRSGRGNDLSDPGNRAGVATWEVDPKFPTDTFTFVRIEYDSGYGGRRGGRSYGGYYGGGGRWATDYPDADLNFSFRLQQLTSLRVNPDPITIRLTDPKLFDYPFIYIIEPGGLVFADEEVAALRKYLLCGGFLMVDDFWGEAEWENFAREFKRVFPDRDPVELPADHEVFRIVYQLKEKPQIPSIHAAHAGRAEGVTFERWDAREVHYKGVFDDKGRMVAFIGHNTDLGDGWEREGEDPWYFKEFSEKKAYPLGINVIVYAMTH